MKLLSIISAIICCLLFSSCNSFKNDVETKIKQMQSEPISIPYDKMECWSTDSIKSEQPWNKAKIKLVHYIDSVQCSTCYLSNLMRKGDVFQLEEKYGEKFYNVFIITPNDKALKKLTYEYIEHELPATIFIDNENRFVEQNPNIPQEQMFHTFLLDEKNNVIFVGSPIVSEELKEKIFDIIDKKLARDVSHR